MKALLLRERCDTCVFWPGNRMRLEPGRFAELIDSNRKTGSMLICHKRITRDGGDGAMCRGYWDAYARHSRVPQIMARLFGENWYEEVS